MSMESPTESEIVEDVPPPQPSIVHLSVAYIIFFAILGCLIRIVLRDLQTYPFQPVFPLLWPQIIGCFFIGYFSILNPSNKELLVGLSTGFCGSLTSFSGMFGDVCAALTTSRKDATLGSVSIIATTLLSSFAAFCIGRKIPKVTDIPKFGHVGPWVSAFVVWISVAILAAFNVKRKATLALVLAPPGLSTTKMAAWSLKFANPKFPYRYLYCKHICDDTLNNDDYNSPQTCGVYNYPGGCLSTISTFIAELYKLTSRYSWQYGVLSIVFGFLISMLGAIDGWKNGSTSC
ncbi:UPF0695 membrane protein [Neolecta irregularis DAH-3]|uniref:UPF0695 membrane protein n=1 Tax=Neolecta irregularis (strain DAH-3) TaxID=1198029 RepID=A0A1U7LLW9_NEOID|nr:UPF0695 membrane protein [Neolecta irregularis DAH-3]|eukprot:OLL23639.1 UPF0695 membrane protein [Neolecta irregularis DAH-3]